MILRKTSIGCRKEVSRDGKDRNEALDEPIELTGEIVRGVLTDPFTIHECPEPQDTNTNGNNYPEETLPEYLLVVLDKEDQGEYGEGNEAIFGQCHVQERETIGP